MRGLNEYITVDESRQDNLRPTSKKELKELIRRRMNEQGPRCDLNDIDVSNVKYMCYMFTNSKFNKDISKWDVSNVRDMDSMFERSSFKKNIRKWDTSRVESMKDIFKGSPLANNKPKWHRS